MKHVFFCLVFSLVGMVGSRADATTATYTLDDVILDDNTQMTGTFSWTFDVGDFENGAGQFSSLGIPWTVHNRDDLDVVFDIGSSIEITLAGSVHDDGVDITLFLAQPLTPTTSSSMDLVRSAYEIGGNGFRTGVFLSGTISPVGVVGTDILPLPGYRLHANTPNPFRRSTTIRYDLAHSAHVDLRLFDAAGRLVRVLENSPKEAGRHEFFWDGYDEAGVRTATGVYFYRIEAGDFQETRKLVRLN